MKTLKGNKLSYRWQTARRV